MVRSTALEWIEFTMSDGDAPGTLLLMIQFRRAEFHRE